MAADKICFSHRARIINHEKIYLFVGTALMKLEFLLILVPRAAFLLASAMLHSVALPKKNAALGTRMVSDTDLKCAEYMLSSKRRYRRKESINLVLNRPWRAGKYDVIRCGPTTSFPGSYEESTLGTRLRHHSLSRCGLGTSLRKHVF